jgi:hypothetical protein
MNTMLWGAALSVMTLVLGWLLRGQPPSPVLRRRSRWHR